MSAINVSGISFAKKRTLKNFLLLYIIMGLFILALIGVLYFESLQNRILSSHRLAMQLQSETFIPKLHDWINSGLDADAYPRDIAYKTALYNYNKEIIAGDISQPHKNFKDNISIINHHIHLVVSLSPYGFGEYYLVFEVLDDRLWIREFLFNSIIYGVLLLGLFAIVGYFLMQMLLRPINDTMTLLDNFIKDTTHELNTPVSAMLTNLEQLKNIQLDPKDEQKLKRLEIASKTISTLYDDLTYLILNHNTIKNDIPLNLSLLLEERIEYFRHKIEQKRIHLVTSIKPDVIVTVDTTKATRVIDNILSNSIKYNKMGGEISIVLVDEYMCISDNGLGIAKDKIDTVFDRYTRATNASGGFGIGLHIVAMIAREYNWKIEIDSQINKGTQITIRW